MKILEVVDTTFERMSIRERRLFSVLAMAVIVLLGGGAYLVTSAVFGGIQTEIDHGRESMIELRQLAPDYIQVNKRKERIEEAIRKNTSSIRVLANDLLKELELSGEVQGATGNRLSDIVSFEGKTTETPVELVKSEKKTKAKKKKDKENAGGIIMIEQNLEFREIPAPDLFKFLDRVEQQKDLLFVTKIDAARTFNDMTHVRASVTIATFQFAEGAEGTGPTQAVR